MKKTALIGLNIGSTSIKATYIDNTKNPPVLLAAGYIPLPERAHVPTSVAEEQFLTNAIARLIKEMKITTVEVSASLPSDRVITRVIELPTMSEKELASSIQWEAEQFIPLPLSKVKLDFAIVEAEPSAQKMKVLIVAAPIDLVTQYMRIIESAKLTVVSLEPEILSSVRSLNQTYPTVSSMLFVHIGATVTEIAAIHNTLLLYTKSYPMGGKTFTRAIAEELNFDTPQAEEYKKTYGLKSTELEGKIAKIITPFLSTIFQEMEKTVAFFKNQYPKEEMKTAILSGGTARLPGFVRLVVDHVGMDTQIIDPFSSITVDPAMLPVIHPDAPSYIIAVGLALKEV